MSKHFIKFFKIKCIHWQREKKLRIALKEYACPYEQTIINHINNKCFTCHSIYYGYNCKGTSRRQSN